MEAEVAVDTGTAVDETTFRRVLARWPSGVGIITTAGPDGRRHGMTASSFSSVSLDPPLVLVCLDRRIRSHELVTRYGVFAVNVLGRDHIGLGRRFAGLTPGVTDRFAEGDWLPGATGSPVLTDAAAWVDCRVRHVYPGGDHTIFVGEVIAAGVPRITSPLLFHSRSWGQLADPLPESVTVADTELARTPAAEAGNRRRAARLTAAVRAAGVRVRLPRDELRRSPALPERVSVLVRDAAEAAEAAAAGCRAVEVTVAADGIAAAAVSVVVAVAGSGTTVVGRIDDALDPARGRAVLHTVDALREAGCGEIALDEAGPRGGEDRDDGSPRHLRRLLQDAVPQAGDARLRLALRDHHGLGLVNALTAMKNGVRDFDTGLAGCGGLLPTERLVLLCSRLGVETPVEREALRPCLNELHTLRCGQRRGGPVRPAVS
ncbi:flavin reductase [Streptomyces gobiensis]|uniref:flavin reductase n=1 Tax=Streptomyces gobiensis TaxID=2875706 RepID=UPI001E31185D|nr:flavin reductase [Streptomyces gobiensis]UGY91932.1 flavin reductase [Streptomyces gobiensis]